MSSLCLITVIVVSFLTFLDHLFFCGWTKISVPCLGNNPSFPPLIGRRCQFCHRSSFSAHVGLFGDSYFILVFLICSNATSLLSHYKSLYVVEHVPPTLNYLGCWVELFWVCSLIGRNWRFLWCGIFCPRPSFHLFSSLLFFSAVWFFTVHCSLGWFQLTVKRATSFSNRFHGVLLCDCAVIYFSRPPWVLSGHLWSFYTTAMLQGCPCVIWSQLSRV